GPRGHDLSENGALDRSQLPRAAAPRTARPERPRLARRTVAALAGPERFDGHRPGHAEDRLGELELDVEREVAPARGAAGPRARTGTAECGAEETLHQVAEIPERREAGRGVRVPVQVV